MILGSFANSCLRSLSLLVVATRTVLAACVVTFADDTDTSGLAAVDCPTGTIAVAVEISVVRTPPLPLIRLRFKDAFMVLYSPGNGPTGMDGSDPEANAARLAAVSKRAAAGLAAGDTAGAAV